MTTMIEFQYSSELPVQAQVVREHTLNMKGVNFELAPLVKMTCPKRFYETSIINWPKNKHVFNSVLLLGGIIPIDIHRFFFTELKPTGFEEKSNTILNKVWHHKRLVVDSDDGCLVVDLVAYETRLPFIGELIKPIYEFIFEHRHKRLREKF